MYNDLAITIKEKVQQGNYHLITQYSGLFTEAINKLIPIIINYTSSSNITCGMVWITILK